MGYEVANDITSLWNELKLAYDKAVKENFARAPEIDAVFSVADNLRCSIMSVDAIAAKQTPHGPLSVDEIDELHTLLWNNVEAFDSISSHNKALFTWREIPVTWRGMEISNIVEAIRNEAMQYSMILRDCSLHNTLVPSSQLRELYPEPWFNLSAVQRIALKLRERLGAGGNKPNAKGSDSAIEQTGKQTEEQTVCDEKQTGDGRNSGPEKKPWTDLANDLRNRWFAEMRKRKAWIPRNRFLIDFFAGSEGQRNKWKDLTPTTEDRRFQDNPHKWKAESEALKASLKNRR